MEISGKIIAVMEAKSGTSSRTGNTWLSQEYVIEIPGQYPRHCVFSVFGEDKIKQLNIHIGEELTIFFEIDAREYNGRWYNDFRAYNVTRDQQQQPSQKAPIDDLPFTNTTECRDDEILPF